MSEIAQVQLHDEAARLLLEAIPNEILNGFHLADFESPFGMSKAEYQNVVLALRATDPITLGCQEATLLRSSLAVTMEALGTEFQTRTGFDLSEAEEVKEQLDTFLKKQVTC